MTKQRKLKTAGFRLNPPLGQLPSADEVHQTLHELSGHEPSAADRRIPFTTALSPRNRALLEVAASERGMAMADVVHDALERYFTGVYIPRDTALTDALERRYSKKAR